MAMTSPSSLPHSLHSSPSTSSANYVLPSKPPSPKRLGFGSANPRHTKSFALRAAADKVSFVEPPPPPPPSSGSKPAPNPELVESLKLKLLSAIFGLNRGLAASREDLQKADAAAKDIEAAGGPVDLLADLDKLQGRWKLIYSSAFSSRTLGGSRPGPPTGKLLPITLGQVFHGPCLPLTQLPLWPGLKVLTPYSSEDARGLLKDAIRDLDPVVFLENELLYGESFPVSAKVLDSSFCLPIGKAKIEREGKDVTITAFSKMVGYSLQAIEILAKEGISAEVINLRSIRHLERKTINDSVRKTNRLVTVEEGFPQHGVGAEICASVVEDSFDYLDAPVERISWADVPMPYAANLERLAVPQVEDIVRAAKRACYKSSSLAASA